MEDAKGNKYIICPAHGDVVKVESSQTDHVGSAKDILQKQCKMIEQLNANSLLAELFIIQFTLEELFVKVNDVYQGTLYFYERYYNDIDNLWNICQACNLHKRDAEPLKWFKENDMFGQAFIDHLNKLKVNDKGFITTAGGLGLAEVAIKWYRENHKDLIKTTKKLYTNVIFKIQENLQKAAAAVGIGDSSKADAYNTQAMLTTALSSIAANVNLRIRVEGTTPPTSPSQSTSDEDKAIIIAKPEKINEVLSNIAKNTNPLQKEMEQLTRINIREDLRQPSNSSSIDADSKAETNNILFKKYMSQAQYHKKLYEKYLKLAEKYKPSNQKESQITDNNQISNSNNTEAKKNQDQMPLSENDASALAGNKRKLTSLATDISAEANITNSNLNPDVSATDAIDQSSISRPQAPSRAKIWGYSLDYTKQNASSIPQKPSKNTTEDNIMDTSNDNESSYTSPRPGSNKQD